MLLSARRLQSVGEQEPGPQNVHHVDKSTQSASSRAISPRAPLKSNTVDSSAECFWRGGGQTISASDRVRGDKCVCVSAVWPEYVLCIVILVADLLVINEGLLSISVCVCHFTDTQTCFLMTGGLEVEVIHKWSRGYSSNTPDQTEEREGRRREEEENEKHTPGCLLKVCRGRRGEEQTNMAACFCACKVVFSVITFRAFLCLAYIWALGLHFFN